MLQCMYVGNYNVKGLKKWLKNTRQCSLKQSEKKVSPQYCMKQMVLKLRLGNLSQNYALP